MKIKKRLQTPTLLTLAVNDRMMMLFAAVQVRFWHKAAFGSKADITKTCGMAALLLGGGFRFRFQLCQLAAQLCHC